MSHHTLRMLNSINTAQPTQAQQKARDELYEDVRRALVKANSADACHAVQAVLEGRPDMSARHLEDLGNRLQRLAWNIDRHDG